MSIAPDGRGYRPARPPVAAAARPYDGRLRVVLGPTNTGKTHLAVERMLGHASGMIGLPLRLLAREVYDRLVHVKGKGLVALITGEERIHPPNPAYFVCTVEAMPLEREVAFLAVDEVQLAADTERGHVFTDRLLRARGREETMFMGAETIRPLLAHLLPGASFETRTRLSRLSYSGPQKLSRLPRRAAVVAFSVNEVYALAELLRRHKGGAAVVMGALSPRTRNAQVALFEDGDVDYLVATDAIGMGLNLNIDHVAFGGVSKFDGLRHRDLTPGELGQIAGRAGRHMNDGTFGTLSEIGNLAPDVVDAVEDHRFPPIGEAQWRSSDVDYSSIEDLIASLEAPPATEGLALTRESEDLKVLKHLAADKDVRDLAAGPAAIGLLWRVCRLPDFAKVMADEHAHLVKTIFRHLMSHDGILPKDWLSKQVSPLDRTDGDVDTLSTRLAHIRTWTYVAHRPDWLHDPGHWQGVTRGIEDRLSDALHERLTQRFVDRRSAVLLRGLKSKGDFLAGVDKHGAVTVEGQYVGQLQGLRFVVDAETRGADKPLVMKAARQALRSEMPRRARQIAEAEDGAFSLDPATGDIAFQGHRLARLAAGADWRRPGFKLLKNDLTETAQRERVEARLKAWLSAHIDRHFAALDPLVAISRGERPATGQVRAIAYRLAESGGHIARRDIAQECRALSREERRTLRKLGVRLGRFDVFLPALHKPAVLALRHALRSIAAGKRPETAGIDPRRTRITATKDRPDRFYESMGYRRIAGQAIRVDVLDKFLTRLAKAEEKGFVPMDNRWPSMLGLKKHAFERVMRELGYQRVSDEREGFERRKQSDPPSRTNKRRRRREQGGKKTDKPMAEAIKSTAHARGKERKPKKV